MDSSDPAAVNAKALLHGPVLVKAKMEQPLPLLNQTCSLGADLPTDLFDSTTANTFSHPSFTETVKKEMVTTRSLIPHTHRSHFSLNKLLFNQNWLIRILLATRIVRNHLSTPLMILC